MAYDSSFDATLTIAFWVGAALLFLTFFLLALLFFLRFALIRKRKHKQDVTDLWFPILQKASLQEFPGTVPQLPWTDIYVFMSIWINLYEVSDEGSRDMLGMIAVSCGAEKHIIKLLKKGNVRGKIMALTLAGGIKDPKFMPLLREMFESRNASLSLAATRAVMMTEPSETVKLLSTAIIARQDWPVARASIIFLEAGLETFTEALVKALSRASISDLPRLINYCHIIPASQGKPILLNLMDNHLHNDDILLGILMAISRYSRFEHLDRLRPCLAHPSPLIRAEAVSAVGKFSSIKEIGGFIRLLEDPHELVQYRTAKALLRFPAIDGQTISQLQNLLQKSESKELIFRVFSERQFQK